MSWVKIDPSWLESDETERLGIEAVMLHLSALSYSCRHESDGRLPQGALRRLWPVSDVDTAIKVLETAGEWERTEEGWFLPNWNEHLLARSEVEHRRQVSRQTSERYRRHKAGDHSICERCSFVRRTGDNVTATSRDLSVTSLYSLDSSRLDSSRSVARETRRETEEGAGLDSAAATSTRAESEMTPHPFADDGSGFQCVCALPSSHPIHHETA